MSELTQTDFQVVSQTFGSWNVRFRLQAAELLNQEVLLHHLRGIKHGLAQKNSVDESHLVFNGILKKERAEEFVDVIVRITKQDVEKGNPKIHFMDNVAPEGTRYANMIALLDLFYLDQFEKPIMLDRVEEAVRQAKLDEDLVDWKEVRDRLKEVIDQKSQLKDIIIARGIFPTVGDDASVEFCFPAAVKPGNTDTYYSSRRVNKGDVLCRVKEATAGGQEGKNVLGEKLPPRKGVNIALNPGNGCILSIDGLEAIADIEGVVVISRKMRAIRTFQGVKEIPKSIEVKVNPIQKVDGSTKVDIVSSDAIEVVGNLSMGSRILTDSEVFVTGNVEAGSKIQASDDINVGGDIDSSDIHSERNVVAQQDVNESKLVAKDQLIVKGTAKHSHLQGETVSAQTVTGGKVVAQKQATIARVGADEDQILSTICVGMTDYFTDRIKENDKFIEKAKANLTQIETVFGSDIMRELNEKNTQLILMRVLSRFRLGQDRTSRQQATVYRKLLESIVPTRTLLRQKEEENRSLRVRVKEESRKDKGMVVITERMGAGTVMNIDGVEAKMPQINQPSEIVADGSENLRVSMKPNGKDSEAEDKQ